MLVLTMALLSTTAAVRVSIPAPSEMGLHYVDDGAGVRLQMGGGNKITISFTTSDRQHSC